MVRVRRFALFLQFASGFASASQLLENSLRGIKVLKL